MTPDRRPQGMGIIVKTVARWLKGFILLYGIYLVLYGHLTHGGGFPGGVVIACAFILLTLADGTESGRRLFTMERALTLAGVGLLAFLLLAALGAWWAGGSFFENFIGTPEAQRFALFSGGIIPAADIALGLMVASALFLVFAVLAALRIARRSDDGGGDGS